MKKIFNKFYLILMGCLIFSACDKLLDQNPVDSIAQNNFWSTPDDATAGVYGMYDGLQNALLFQSVWGDLRADIFSNKRGNLVNDPP